MGAVHDFVSLSGSLRHEGRSIGSIIGEYIGEEGKNLLLWFAFLTIILVVAVFAFVVALVFQEYPSAATASLLYIALALVFGVYLYQLDLPFIPGTAVFVVARLRERLRRDRVPDPALTGHLDPDRVAVRLPRERAPGLDAAPAA